MGRQPSQAPPSRCSTALRPLAPWAVLWARLFQHCFLFAIAIVNLLVFRSIYRAFVRVRRGEPYVDEDFDLLLADRGFLSRIFRPMFA